MRAVRALERRVARLERAKNRKSPFVIMFGSFDGKPMEPGTGLMPADGAPAWLVAPQGNGVQQEAPITSRHKDATQGIVEPYAWKYDGGKRREPVLDTDFNRVIRKVGWRHCLKCRKPFFSEDVVRLRLCGGQDGCRTDYNRHT